MDKVIRC